jgi:hypothetical protein
MQGYGALLTQVNALRELVKAYRKATGSWPLEAQAHANAFDTEYMGYWSEQPASEDVRQELLDFALRERSDFDPEVFAHIECSPGDKKAYVRFKLATATRIELHGAPVTEGKLEVNTNDDWQVEVTRFNGPAIDSLKVKVGSHAADLARELSHWGMILLYPNEGKRVVWVSTPTLACTIHFQGELVTESGCMPIPGRSVAPSRPTAVPTSSTTEEESALSGTQDIPGVPALDDDYTGLDYDYDDYTGGD